MSMNLLKRWSRFLKEPHTAPMTDRRRLVLGATGATVLGLLIFLGALAAQEKSPEPAKSSEPVATTKTTSADPAKSDSVATKTASVQKSRRDPFTISEAMKNQAANGPIITRTPTPTTAIATPIKGEINFQAIKVKALLILKDQPPLAALSVPGYDNLLYVKPGDTIRLEGTVPTTEENNGGKSKSEVSVIGTATEVFMLEVKKISSQGVEVGIAGMPGASVTLK